MYSFFGAEVAFEHLYIKEDDTYWKKNTLKGKEIPYQYGESFAGLGYYSGLQFNFAKNLALSLEVGVNHSFVHAKYENPYRLCYEKKDCDCLKGESPCLYACEIAWTIQKQTYLSYTSGIFEPFIGFNCVYSRLKPKTQTQEDGFRKWGFGPVMGLKIHCPYGWKIKFFGEVLRYQNINHICQISNIKIERNIKATVYRFSAGFEKHFEFRIPKIKF